MDPVNTEEENLPSKVFSLLVKHLPSSLPPSALQKLFGHYGAVAVRNCVAGKLKNCAFVDFKSEVEASRAKSQLHRLRLLNKVLLVEDAKPLPSTTPAPTPSTQETSTPTTTPPTGPSAIPPSISSSSPSHPQVLYIKGESGQPHEPKAAAIAPTLGIDHPFPPHLEYLYPPPDGHILTNIVNALIAVPRLYTQVLHLMNKMNLPPPFRPAMPTPPLPPAEPPPPVPEPPMEPPPKPSASGDDPAEVASGSEDEDEEEEEKRDSSALAPPSKRRKVEVGRPPKEVDPSLIPSVIQRPGVATSLAIKKKTSVLQFKFGAKKPAKGKAGPPSETPGGGGGASEARGWEAEEEEGAGRIAVDKLTREKLTEGCVPPEDILAIPMFKNHTPGDPSPVLYIKNLARDTSAADLMHIFELFFDSPSAAKSLLNIRLMQEGRMKGQAFVTFPTVEMAKQAMDHAHGFKLKEKPMVIQFGRKPGEARKEGGQHATADDGREG